jgi:hypothetical protein
MLGGPWSTITYILSAGCQWAALPSGMSRSMQGLMMQAIVHTADFQHHDGGMLLLDYAVRLISIPAQALRPRRLSKAHVLDRASQVCHQVNVESVKGLAVPLKHWRLSAPSVVSTDAVGWPRTGNA